MDFDPEIVEWTELHGSVSDFSFMVFGPVEDLDLKMLAKGIADHFRMAELETSMLIYSNEINEEEARMLQTYQGTNVHVVIPRLDEIKVEELIVILTRDCFTHLRLKSEYIGHMESDSLV